LQVRSFDIDNLFALAGYDERKGAGHIDFAVVVAVAGNFVADDSNRQGHFSILFVRGHDSLPAYDLKDALIAAAVSDPYAGGEGEAFSYLIAYQCVHGGKGIRIVHSLGNPLIGLRHIVVAPVALQPSELEVHVADIVGVQRTA